MDKLNTNTFRSTLDYLTITKNSNTINIWLLGINFAILYFLITNFIKPTGVFCILLNENIYFKYLCFLLFIWLTINVIILIVFSYIEKILSLTIEDNYFRLKSFMSYMDSIKDISEEELLKMDMFKIHELTNNVKTRKVIDEYISKIMKYKVEIVKWSNKRLLIYRFVILVSIPLLATTGIIVFYNF